jgi:hypothetical protein
MAGTAELCSDCRRPLWRHRLQPPPAGYVLHWARGRCKRCARRYWPSASASASASACRRRKPLVVDDVAVDRACRGGRVRLTPTERKLAVGRLTGAGYSTAVTAERLAVTTRTVTRIRRQLTAGWQPRRPVQHSPPPRPEAA